MAATTLFSDSAKLLIEIQTENKLDAPFIFVTGFGAGDSIDYTSKAVKEFIETALKDVYADKTKMEGMITNSNLGSINRADVADFLVRQAENPTELKKYVAISAN